MKNVLCFLFIFAFTLPAIAANSTQSETINALLGKNALKTDSIEKRENADYNQAKIEWCNSVKKQWPGNKDEVYFDYSKGECVTPQAQETPPIIFVAPFTLFY